MNGHSILFPNAEPQTPDLRQTEPEFFTDLNLDQIVANITAGKDEYDLKPFFYTGPLDLETIQYRHEVMRDLEAPRTMEAIKTFSAKVRRVEERLASIEKLHDRYHREGLFLEAVDNYCQAVLELFEALSSIRLLSRGLALISQYLQTYTQATRFRSMFRRAQELRQALLGIEYCVLIKGTTVSVRNYESESDYSAEVERVFERFKQGTVTERKFKFPHSFGMNHIQASILDGIAKMQPDVFAALDAYHAEYATFVDACVTRFAREAQFYLAYLDHIAPLRRAGLPFCYPGLSKHKITSCNLQGFDLALASKLLGGEADIVCNDFELREGERVIVVTGPNHGGKTTFARTFGQLHYLAAIGCPVPGHEARLFLYDSMFTHFGRSERVEDLRGKLQDDLIRIHDVLRCATPRSVVIMNEIFTSTSLADARFLGRKIIERIMKLDALGVCITFIDELASLDERIVSMVATVDPEDPSQRTFKIVRKPAEGLAYAMALAERRRLSYAWVKRRLAS